MNWYDALQIRFFALTGMLLLGSNALTAQPALPGLPLLHNFEKSVYLGGAQNWEIAQTQEGVLLIANNEGLLTYDGVNWDKYPLPNRTIVRSVKAREDGRIFVGGQDEFGYFEPDSHGVLTYISLIDSIHGQGIPIADVWDIALFGAQTFFRTRQQVFLFEGNRLSLLLTDDFLFMGMAGGRLLLQSQTGGLLEWTENQFSQAVGGSVFQNKLITDVQADHSGQVFVCTLMDGIFQLGPTGITPFPLASDPLIRNLRTTGFLVLQDGTFAVGSELGGVLVIHPDGHLLYKLDGARGLQNNFVTALYEDLQHNLWIALNNGLTLAETNSPYMSLSPDSPLEGTSYAAVRHQNDFYFGTSNGLYVFENNSSGTKPGRFVPGTASQVWGLDPIGDYLMLAHNEGSFHIQNTIARPHAPGSLKGVWLHLGLRARPGYVVAGHYGGLALYKTTAAGLTFLRTLEGFSESCRFLVEDDAGVLWASHPYRGIYRMELDPDMRQVSVTRFGAADGLPSHLYNHVFYIKGEVVAVGERGIYRFAPATNRFIPHPDYTALFNPDERIIRLKEDQNGHIWYASDQRVGIIQVADKGLTRYTEQQDFPRIRGKLVGGFEFIYPVSDSLVIFGMDKGCLLFSPKKAAANTPGNWQAMTSKVYFSGARDSLLAGLWRNNTTFTFPHQINNFRFHFAATDFADPEGLTFRFRLTGLENKWSDWLPIHSKEYTKLPPGEYTFELQAKNPVGQQSNIAAFRFQISPPWYATWGARLGYALAFIAVLAGLVLIPRRRFEKEKTELETRHASQKAAQQQELDRSKE